MNHVSPFASRAVKPGAKPDDFSRITVHFSLAGGGPGVDCRTMSAAVSGCVPIRFVNQLESGTSSIVLTFCARTCVGRRDAVTNRL
jgi:hypothetical protein